MYEVIKQKIKIYLPDDANIISLLKGSALAFVLRILGALSGFLMNLVVARTLGAEQAGYFFLAFTIVTILAAFSRLGLDNTLIRFIAAYREKKDWIRVNGVYRTAMTWTMVASSIVAFGLWALADWGSINVFHKPELAGPLRMMSASVILLALSMLHGQALQGMQRIRESVFTLNVSTQILTVFGLLIFGIFWEDYNAIYVSAIFTCASFFTLTFAVRWWWRGDEIYFSGKMLDSVNLRKSCMPLLVVVMMNQTIQWSSQIIIGYYTTPNDVAILAVAQRTSMLTSFVLLAVNLVAAPKFSAMYSRGDMLGLKRLAIYATKIITLFAIPVVGVMMFFPDMLMSMFGEEFQNQGLVLQILVVGQFVNVATGSVAILLIMCGYERDVRAAAIISALISLILAFLFVPIWGVVGGAFATSATVASQNLLLVYFVNKRMGFNILKKIV